MIYINKTPTLQTINLRSGKSLYAYPGKHYTLDAGDEFSLEIQIKVKSKTGTLMSQKTETPPMKVKVSHEPERATLPIKAKKLRG